jgi:hypothetical protein
MIDDLIVIDDFFDDPYSIRNIALNSQFYTIGDYQKEFDRDHNLGWKGYRSNAISDIDADIQNFTIEKIFSTCLNNRYKSSINWNYQTKSNLYFHYLDNTFSMLPNDIHKDTVPYAGVVYLSPDPDQNSGTTLFADSFDIDQHIENKFNRLVLYNGNKYHSPTKGFGCDISNSRLTMLIFISSVSIEVSI